MSDELGRPLRVLHLPELVGGNPTGLAAAERRQGLDSRCISLLPSPLDYTIDRVMSHSQLGAELARPRLLRETLAWADVVHFNFGRSIAPQRIEGTRLDGSRPVLGAAIKRLYNAYAGLLEYRDVDLLARRGKVIAVTFQGDDVRQYDKMLPGNIAGAETQPSADNEARRRRVAKWSTRADLMFALNPDLLRVLPPSAEFQAYASVDAKAIQPASYRPRGDRLRVVHAPTSRSVKGTRFLVAAIDRLAARGVDVELDLVEGVAHEQALDRYARADVVVDQLLLGWYGALAVEAMALGKPVVGFVADDDLALAPRALADDLPMIRADHSTIGDVLEALTSWPDAALRGVGERSRAFALSHHDPDRIASTMKVRYERAVSRKNVG